jgi:hypothetical protein
MSPHPQAKIWFVPSQLGRLGEANYKELVLSNRPTRRGCAIAPSHVKTEADSYVYGHHSGDFKCCHVSIVWHTVILIHNSFGRFGRPEVPSC